MIGLRAMKNEFNDHGGAYSVYEGAPSKTIYDNEGFGDGVKSSYKKFPDSSSAGRLQMRVTDTPINLLELIYDKKCTECSDILTNISSALSHYNSGKHQTKLAFLFMPHGVYNLPISKEELHAIEIGVNKHAISFSEPQQLTFRELVKKFEITEDIKKLDTTNCRLCQCSFMSKFEALKHYGSKKHKKNVENDSPYNPLLFSGVNEEPRCDLCNVPVDSFDPIEAHLTSRKHMAKMQSYLEQVHAGNIMPPMSSRGFYDFNNVEREEANPFDASKFIQEVPQVAGRLSGPQMAGRLSGPMMVAREEGRGDQGMPYQMAYHQQLQQVMPVQGGYMGEYGAMGQSFPLVGGMQYGMGGYGMQAQAEPPMAISSFIDGTRMVHQQQQQPSWAQPIQGANTPANASYTSNIASRLGNKVQPDSFGPTKFKYSKKQQY